MLPIIYIYNLISMKMMQNGEEQNKKPTYTPPPPPPTGNETIKPTTQKLHNKTIMFDSLKVMEKMSETNLNRNWITPVNLMQYVQVQCMYTQMSSTKTNYYHQSINMFSTSDTQK